MKLEAKIVWGPEVLVNSLPEIMRDLCREADECGMDVEVLSEHRKVGRFEVRVRLVPRGQRELDLPPIRATAAAPPPEDT
jgi:hypothetical protein